MDDLHPSDLKTILHSQRANLYYLEHCRVLVNTISMEFASNNIGENVFNGLKSRACRERDRSSFQGDRREKC